MQFKFLAKVLKLENNLDRTKAESVVTELWPAHVQAVLTFRQLTNHMRSQSPSLVPAPLDYPELVLPALPTLDAPERRLLKRWKAYLKWEESDPLELEKRNDSATLVLRIQYVYRKALIHMWYHDEIWFMAYEWFNKVGKHDEASTILKMGIKANPDRYADLD